MQEDLDIFINDYNKERTNQGKRCQGRTQIVESHLTVTTLRVKIPPEVTTTQFLYNKFFIFYHFIFLFPSAL